MLWTHFVYPDLQDVVPALLELSEFYIVIVELTVVVLQRQVTTWTQYTIQFFIFNFISGYVSFYELLHHFYSHIELHALFAQVGMVNSQGLKHDVKRIIWNRSHFKPAECREHGSSGSINVKVRTVVSRIECNKCKPDITCWKDPPKEAWARHPTCMNLQHQKHSSLDRSWPEASLVFHTSESWLTSFLHVRASLDDCGTYF